MQTFLPYADFFKIAKVLDKKRCWKQVVEAKQIICTLRGLHLPDDWTRSRSYQNQGWINHPAVHMWSDHTELLKHYYNVLLNYCKNDLEINTSLPYIESIFSSGYLDGTLLVVHKLLDDNCYQPWWMHHADFHRSHRARLLLKDIEHYFQYFEDDLGFNDAEYLWPDMDNFNFYTI